MGLKENVDGLHTHTLGFWNPLLPTSTMAGPGKENRVLQLGIQCGVAAMPVS